MAGMNNFIIHLFIYSIPHAKILEIFHSAVEIQQKKLGWFMSAPEQIVALGTEHVTTDERRQHAEENVAKLPPNKKARNRILGADVAKPLNMCQSFRQKIEVSIHPQTPFLLTAKTPN